MINVEHSPLTLTSPLTTQTQIVPHSMASSPLVPAENPPATSEAWSADDSARLEALVATKGRKWRKIRDEDFRDHTVAQVRNRYLRMEKGKTTVEEGTFHYRCRRCGLPRRGHICKNPNGMVFRRSADATASCLGASLVGGAPRKTLLGAATSKAAPPAPPADAIDDDASIVLPFCETTKTTTSHKQRSPADPAKGIAPSGGAAAARPVAARARAAAPAQARASAQATAALSTVMPNGDSWAYRFLALSRPQFPA